jgi:hypothetical protein
VALIQCAILSRSTFLGARADWTELWYSDYARGPSAYGGKPGKIHKLYETSLGPLYESEDPLHQLLEARSQLGFMLVHVTLLEALGADLGGGKCFQKSAPSS